jgi:large subunit ribosomal protein L21
MFAVIRAGGKQHKVSEGDVIDVERLDVDGAVSFEPLLVVTDDGAVRSLPSELAGASVSGRVVGDVRGPKVRVLRFRNKSGYRRHTGHRQRYTRVEISGIRIGERRSGSSKTKDKVNDDGS